MMMLKTIEQYMIVELRSGSVVIGCC